MVSQRFFGENPHLDAAGCLLDLESRYDTQKKTKQNLRGTKPTCTYHLLEQVGSLNSSNRDIDIISCGLKTQSMKLVQKMKIEIFTQLHEENSRLEHTQNQSPCRCRHRLDLPATCTVHTFSTQPFFRQRK